MRDGMRLYGHYVSIHVKSMMQYKSSFLLAVTGQVLVSFYVFFWVFFLFLRFFFCLRWMFIYTHFFFPPPQV